MLIVTAAEMQAMDRMTITQYGLPGRVLMENAGRGAAQCFLNRIFQTPGPVGVVAGCGNNGGDGFVIARYLAQRGIAVRVYLLGLRDRVQGDAAANLALLPDWAVPLIELHDADSWTGRQGELRHCRYWIDAILGTGLTATVSGYFGQVIESINGWQRPLLAVDIPSGLNADTGRPCGVAIQATATATFGYPKIAHTVYPGVEYCGPVDLIDIGIPTAVAQAVGPRQRLLDAPTVRALLPRRAADSHKGTHGHVLVIGGSPGKTGAAAMTATAALRTGAGLVTLGCASSLNTTLETQLLEAMTLPLPDLQEGILGPAAFTAIAAATVGKNVLALGPGIGTAPATRELVLQILREIDLPLVLDADGLNIIAGQAALFRERRAPLILTPHPGEAARLLQQPVAAVQQDRLGSARRLAAHYNAIVVLKGARTVIAETAGNAWINTSGNPGMAVAGMGDVLTGIIAGLLAQGLTPLAAAQAGVFLHGAAADRLADVTAYGYLAGDLLTSVPAALQEINRGLLSTSFIPLL